MSGGLKDCQPRLDLRRVEIELTTNFHNFAVGDQMNVYRSLLAGREHFEQGGMGKHVPTGKRLRKTIVVAAFYRNMTARESTPERQIHAAPTQ